MWFTTIDELIADKIAEILNGAFQSISDKEKMEMAVLKMKQKLIDDLFSGVTEYNFKEFIDKGV